VNFELNKYKIIKKAISLEKAKFASDYLLLKSNVIKYLYSNKIIEEQNMLGTFKDTQAPNVYSIYADTLMEVFLNDLLPLVEKKTNLKLYPTYSYSRVYENGSDLKRHKDRPSCEISTTLNLGGDLWPIYLSPNENVGIPESDGGKQGIILTSNAKGIEIVLEPGDMLIYAGCELEHWRETFRGKYCTQVFLHYNRVTKSNENLFDQRPMLGLPADWRK
jgi:hypothetical protein